MDRAVFDDRLDELVRKTIQVWTAAKDEITGRADRDELKRTQLKAIAVHAESRGASGLTALIAHRRRLNEKNEKAWKEKKGTKAPQHKAFWDTLHKICDTDLKELADAHGDADAVFAEFAHRLSTELMWERRNNEARK